MSSTATSRRRALLGATGLVTLMASGLVLATSWFVAFPLLVVQAAWLVAIAAMITVFIAAFREARATDTGFLTALGRSFKALGQFIFWYF
jgi:hypothetical protein